MKRLLFSLCIALALVGCSSPPKEEKHSSLESRIMSQPDYNKVSRYEKAFNTAGAGDNGQGSFFGKKSVKGSDFGGLKNFKAGSYKTGAFAQGKQSSKFASTQSTFATKANRMGNSSFKTKSSTFGRETATEGTRMFSGADDTVRARSFQPAEKSLKANKHPVLIVKPGEPREKVAYTEDQVKSLLGR